jgi:D-methionine transport system substrate-binding protein
MRFLLSILLACTVAACNKPTSQTLTVGTIAGPETDLVVAAKNIAEKKYGLSIKIVEFNDYNLPNAALEDGSLDVNVYQHKPYLDAAMKNHGYHLVIVGKTFIYPMGIYSKRFKNLSELPQNAWIAIPNDPSNEARALQLLQQANLITLKNPNSTSIADIQSNPKNLKFKELDAAQLPRILPDVDAAIINTGFAIPAGLSPIKDALFIENKDSPYVNLVVMKKGNPKKEQIELFVKALHDPAVKEKAKELFGDAAIPAW